MFQGKFVLSVRLLIQPDVGTQWSTEVAGRHRIASTELYVECDIGNLTYEYINLLKLLHSASIYRCIFTRIGLV